MMSHKWSRQETKMLLEMIIAHNPTSLALKTRLWHKVVKEMQLMGATNINVRNVDRKFRNMMRTYRDNKRRIEHAGVPYSNWEFYPMMQFITKDWRFSAADESNDKTYVEATDESNEQTYVEATDESNDERYVEATDESKEKTEVEVEVEEFDDKLLLEADEEEEEEDDDDVVCIDDDIEIKSDIDLEPTQIMEHANTADDEARDVDIDAAYGNMEELEFQRVEQLTAIRALLEQSAVLQQERNELLHKRNQLMEQYLSAKRRRN
ncbi:maker679 [Drosophila busckii]|uniref:Maker679 n=1 Tax=Drosophila busckii TaxID=30019 RepID=A0A0M3QW83_DROBS|nr:kinesin-like protein KIF21A [Drosophila busckii]ALC43693.1 maker679 [Drosophila busckii]